MDAESPATRRSDADGPPPETAQTGSFTPLPTVRQTLAKGLTP